MTEEKRASLPGRTPRTWHGMTVSVWYELISRNRFAIAPSRWPMACAVSCFSVLNSTLRLMSEAVYARQAAEVVIDKPPLFVIGHWRTGTTWLHELLVKDERLSFPTTYQCMAPHHFALTNWLGRMLDWTLPASRPMDDMPLGMRRPQEDEFALMNLGAKTPYLEWAFPNHHERFDEYLTLQELSAEEQQAWVALFDWFVRRLTLLSPQRLVLKSPTHTARVATLRRLYPGASFVHVVRNPLDTIPSTIRTWTRMTDSMSLQVRREPISPDRILDVFQRMYDQFEQDRPQIPAGRYYEVRYEDLVADPLAEMERIYDQLGLDDFAVARPAMEAYLASIAGYQPNRHQVPAELKSKILHRCKDYMDRYGYREPVFT